MIRKLMTFIYGFVFVRMLASAFKKKWFFYTHPYVLNGIKQMCLCIDYKGIHYAVTDACVYECYDSELRDLVKYLESKYQYMFSFPDLNIIRVNYICVKWYLFLNMNFYTTCTLDTLPINGSSGQDIKKAALAFLKHRKPGIWYSK